MFRLKILLPSSGIFSNLTFDKIPEDGSEFLVETSEKFPETKMP